MPRFYDPKTGTEALEGIHDTNGCTADEDMPEASQEWFERPARDGHQWETDPTGKFPIEVPIPPPSDDELKATEKEWARSELYATDRVFVKDTKYTEEEQKAVETYRQALRNPEREKADGFPDTSWRPQWPEGVKHPRD